MGMSRKKKLYVRPGAFIPPGIDDIEYKTSPQSDDVYDDDVYEIVVEGDENKEQGLPIPHTFTIVKQNVRRNADGTKVVDVTCETEDYPGISQVDVRVTKA